MAFPKKISDLCTPAQIYFFISFFVIFISIIQNIGNNGKYSLGYYSVKVPSVIILFIFKIIYIFFWTWILNLICKSGHKGIAWLLILLPFILLFAIIGLVLINK